MEQFIVDQIKYGLRYLPSNVIRSFAIPDRSYDSLRLRRDFVCGVCHPDENYDLLKEGNIGWVRFDVPFPFDENGAETQSYKAFKERCRGYAERGIKVMAVTPFPAAFLENGIDCRKESDEGEIMRISKFLYDDLRPLCGGFQIANEITIPRFTLPFTVKEGAKFLGLCMKAMYPHDRDFLVGYNCAGPAADLNHYMKPWLQYADYVGLDMYLGCFFNAPGFMWMLDALVRYLWSLTGKPVLVEEFGYIGAGAPKTAEEKKKILARYGISSKKEALADPETFISRIPQRLRNEALKRAGGDPLECAKLVFGGELKNHLYSELPPTTKIPGYDHTPEGQAKFFTDAITMFYNKKYVVGTIVYCWKDSDMCYVCGNDDCPTETRWGLVDCDGKPKPSFYAVKDVYGKIKARTL